MIIVGCSAEREHLPKSARVVLFAPGRFLYLSTTGNGVCLC